MTAERAVHELRVQAPSRLAGSRTGTLAFAVCVCAFVAALAVGGVSSRVGSPPTGSLVALELAGLTVMGVLVVLLLAIILMARGWKQRQDLRVALWKRLLSAAVVTAVVVGILAVMMSVAPRLPVHQSVAGRPHPRAPGSSLPAPQAHTSHGTGWAGGAALAAGAVLGVVALFLLLRRPRPGPRAPGPEDQLERAIEAGIDGLESDDDPRRAVIKAYAGMEHALAEDGLPRRPSETPLEFLQRALDHLHASAGAIRRLTGLFEQARFSTHVIDEPMRAEALAALRDLRAELAR